MPSIGIDFGTTYATMAVLQSGVIEILTNETSSRLTPCMAAFSDKERFLGESALTQFARNIPNTILDTKVILGRKWNEPEVQEFAKNSGYKLIELPNNEIGIQVLYQGEKRVFTVVQVTAMILQKMKEISEKAVGTSVKDVCISIPGFYTDSQRRALSDASKVAGLNCLRFIHDNTATAIQYGWYKFKDLSEKDPSRVMFVDMGSHSTQVTIVDFLKSSMKVVAYTYDKNLGGKDFDQILVNNFVEEFKQKYKIDARTNGKALIRLQVAAEKLKKLLNTVPEGPINIDCFMNDIDVKGMMKRADFETLSASILDRLESPIKRALEDAGTTADKLASIEITGSGTRLLCVQNKLNAILGREVSKGTNSEESVARGCALQCAFLSPLFRAPREFDIKDVYPFPVKISWKYNDSNAMTVDTDQVEVFQKNNVLPSAKKVTVTRDKGFEIEAKYSQPESLPVGSQIFIEKLVVPSLPQKQGESKVRVNVKIDINGIVHIDSAQVIEPASNAPESGAEGEAKPQAEGEAQTPVDTAATTEGKPDVKSPESASKEPEKKKLKLTALAANHINYFLAEAQLNQFTEDEHKMQASDKLAIETVDRKNAVESYVYDMRSKISDMYSAYSTEKEKETFSKMLEDTENWLYEDGADQTKSVYVRKLDEMKALGDPISKRYQENETRYEALSAARSTIENYKLAATSLDPKYDHIEKEERDKVIKEAEDLEKYLHDQMAKQDALPKSTDPIIKSADILKKKTELERFSNAILNKAKPKPKPAEPKPTEQKPEEKKAEQKPTDATPEQQQQQPQQQPQEPTTSSEQPKKDDMDLD